jgi:hypothetical protein
MSASSFSLHIGINHVDTNHYQGWDGRLRGCENDALFYHQLAVKEGCTVSKLLLNRDGDNLPTAKNVLGFLDYSIAELEAGDNLIITYSGHGGILEDKNYDEHDFQDETWCLYDRQLLDDELFAKFSRFRSGVNIVLISDSCHSGSVSKGDEVMEWSEDNDATITLPGTRRYAPRQQLFGAYQANRYLYEPLMKMPMVRKEEIAAGVLQLGACQDNEFAMEDGEHGLFTKTVMRILQGSGTVSSYQELLLRAKRALTGIQKPNLIAYGNDHTQLLQLRPFGATSAQVSDNAGLHPQLLGEEATLIIESDNINDKVRDIAGMRVEEWHAGSPGASPAIYQCNCTIAEPGMYPWDHAYQQFWLLKQNGCVLSSVLPLSITGAAPNVLLSDPRVELLRKLLGGRVRSPRGLGRKSTALTDEVLLRMFAMETLDVILRDNELRAFRNLLPEALETHLVNADNYKQFVGVLKNSIFSSDTLTAHLCS